MDKGLSLNEKIQSLAKKLMAKYIEGSKPDNEELIQECKELTKKVLKKLGEEPETKETDEEGPWKFKCPECGTTALFSNPWTKRICPSCGKEMVAASKEKGPKEDVGFGSPVPSHVFDLVHRRLSKIGQAVKLSPNNYLYKTPHGNIALNLLTGNWKHVRGTEVVNQGRDIASLHQHLDKLGKGESKTTEQTWYVRYKKGDKVDSVEVEAPSQEAAGKKVQDEYGADEILKVHVKESIDEQRRVGRPRTDAERRKRHLARFGTDKLPPRGTGLKRKSVESVDPIDQFLEQWKTLPKGWTKDSLEKFARSLTGKTKGDPEGFVRACVAKMKDTGIDDPEAFCASLKDKYLGRTTWRGPSD